MSSDRRTCASVCALALGAAAAVATPDDLAACLIAQRVLSNACLTCGSSGTVDISFETALAVVGRDSLLVDVQRAHAATLAPGQKAKFAITQPASNTYHHVNSKKRVTRIRELRRVTDGHDKFDILFYVTGDRFFGRFEALVHVVVRRVNDNEVRIQGVLYAYPHSAPVRFIARRRPVRAYFRKETDEVTGRGIRILRDLCAAREQTASRE